MQKFDSHLLGIEQGDVTLFSHFEDGGEMWSGDGQREIRSPVNFSEVFDSSPLVTVALSMFDGSSDVNTRFEVAAEAVNDTGFEIVFRTWGDSKIARARVSWQAIGPRATEEVWDI